jgi:hypothetical protein
MAGAQCNAVAGFPEQVRSLSGTDAVVNLNGELLAADTVDDALTDDVSR